MEALLHLLDKSKDFELLQTFFTVLIRIHGDLMVAHPEQFSEILQKVSCVVEVKWAKLEHLFQEVLCMIDYVREA